MLMQTFLAVCEAALDERFDSPMRRVLDRKLGAGWALEYAKTRSKEERVDLIERRLLMCSRTVVSASSPSRS